MGQHGDSLYDIQITATCVGEESASVGAEQAAPPGVVGAHRCCSGLAKRRGRVGGPFLQNTQFSKFPRLSPHIFKPSSRRSWAFSPAHFHWSSVFWERVFSVTFRCLLVCVSVPRALVRVSMWLIANCSTELHFPSFAARAAQTPGHQDWLFSVSRHCLFHSRSSCLGPSVKSLRCRKKRSFFEQ